MVTKFIGGWRANCSSSRPRIIRQIEKTKFDKILSKPNDSLIEIIGDELDKAFIDSSLKLGS